ncbi:molybdopterin converting factor subunit 1 [Cupriavidus sp. YAF13]|uniref:molybdopterin converting factor subunit 1 n=1 Tax=Cupriavidus sp. YAF13 TaxID=3233075 RepID=UPI003F91ED8A
MNIELRFFASVREQLSLGQERVAVPAEVVTVADLRRWLGARGGAWAEVLAEGRALRMAVDHEVASADSVLAEGCEVAFFPPVTGG